MLLCLGAASCAPHDPGEAGTYQEPASEPVYLNYRVYRLVDKQAQVVCYTYTSYGISCVPMSQTALQEK